MHCSARSGTFARIEKKIVMLLGLLEANLAGATLFLTSILSPDVFHGHLARIRLLLALGGDHSLAHTNLTDEKFHPPQFNRLTRFQPIAFSFAILVLLLAHNQVGLLLSEGYAVGLLRVRPFRANLAEPVVSVVNKIQPESMGRVGDRLHFELGQELKLVLINWRFLAIGRNDHVGCMREGGTLTFSIEGDSFGVEREGEGVRGDLVGLVVEERMRVLVPSDRLDR